MTATARLFSPGQIAVATALGSVPAALWLVAANFEAVGRASNARALRLWTFPVSVLLIGGLMLLPGSVPVGGAIGLVAGAYQGTKQLNVEILGKAYLGQIERAPWGRVFVVSAIAFVAIIAFIALAITLFD